MKKNNFLKTRNTRRWVSYSAIILLPFLFYFGYCWGWWGKNSLLFQYLFQCTCPMTSEEARYPDEVDVIVSACNYQRSILSPSGRLLYIEKTGSSSPSLLNLQTNQQTLFTLPEGQNYFLTDDLMFHTFYGDDEYIWEISSGKQYPLARFARLYPSAYINGEVDVTLLAERLREAEDVFLIDDDNILALGPEFKQYPELNFNILRSDIPGRDANRAEQFLQTNNITYQFVSDGFPEKALSPDSRFIARADGIYSAGSGLKIVEAYSARGFFHPYSGKDFSVRGWLYDSSAVIYSKFLNPCLIEASFFLSDEPGCFFQVSQPLLKLKVPEEYFSANEIQ